MKQYMWWNSLTFFIQLNCEIHLKSDIDFLISIWYHRPSQIFGLSCL